MKIHGMLVFGITLFAATLVTFLPIIERFPSTVFNLEAATGPS